jgi:methionyl-tRNA formyltransferase
VRIALLTLEGLAGAAAVRRFVVRHPERIAVVGLSNAFHSTHAGAHGGMISQLWRYLSRTPPSFLPYLAINFIVPRVSRLAWALCRRGGPERTPLDVTCARLGIPVVKIDDVNAPATQRALTAHGAALAVSFHFDKILSAETIGLFPQGGINVHAALLPLHRGPVPTLHALLDEVPRFGVTVHRLAPRIDAGAILAQTALDLPPNTSALAAALALHHAALPLLEQTLAALATGRAEERVVETAAYCGFPSRSQMRELARRGRCAADFGDFVAALNTPV